MLSLWVAVMAGIALFAQDKVIDLTGPWDLSLGDSTKYSDYVMLPGSIQADGTVWYKRTVYVPQSWAKQRMVLHLERPHTETTVYVNGAEVGQQQSMAVPHEYDVSRSIVPGQRNTIAVKGFNGNGKDHWNGIVGKMALSCQPSKLYIQRVRVRPDMEKGKLHLDIDVNGAGVAYLFAFDDMEIAICKDGDENGDIYLLHAELNRQRTSVDIPVVDKLLLWDAFRPNVYRLGISVGDDYYETTFGMRGFDIEDHQLFLNDKPIWLRGIVDDGSSLATNALLADEDSWTNIFAKYKEYGLNYVHFNAYCPPEAAFVAADRLGLYLQPELSQLEESRRMVDTYGHHPSFMQLRDSLNLPIIANRDSGEAQISFYKEEIERNLLASDCAGFRIPVQDIPWIGKGNTNLQKWQEFCSPVVPLAAFQKQTFTTADTLVVPVQAYNAMFGNLSPVRTSYYIADGDRHVLAGGQLAGGVLPVGKNLGLGTVRFPLVDIKQPTKLTLSVAITNTFRNHWDFWVYPEETHPEDTSTLR